MLKKILKSLALTFIALTFSSLAWGQNSEKSVARQWNEVTLSAIRKDYARPTIAARNLFHMSMIAYDGWSMYVPFSKNYYAVEKVPTTGWDAETIEKNQIKTISVASYLMIVKRFSQSPQAGKVIEEAKQLALHFGIDVDHLNENDPAIARGVTLAQMVISFGESDGSLESENYQSPVLEFIPLNPPLIVKFPGAGKIKNVNFWQPLALDSIIDQGGNPLPSNIQFPLTLHWGRVTPFALQNSDRSPVSHLYFDPGPPPQFGGQGHEEYVQSMVQVIKYSSWLDPEDKKTLNISPAALGNNLLGTNDGRGRPLNPFTGLAYEDQIVPRGDYTRVLAEFWADGPQSETPPGHWNVVANQICDHPDFQRKWMGLEEIPSKLEWDAKMYLTLNGALHDTAIAIWGIKGYYQGSRPISAIRYMGTLGQSSSPELPHYHKLGLPLVPDLIELVTEENTRPGQKLSHLVGNEGKIAVRSWQGPPVPLRPNKGVNWILAEEWIPYQKSTFVTPPFPGYVSGHSGYSRAAAEVLTAITGSEYFPGGIGEYKFQPNAYLSFEVGPTQPIRLQWATYYDAADQSALSRIFGGIHGNIDDFPARKIGSKVGKKAVAKARNLFR